MTTESLDKKDQRKYGRREILGILSCGALAITLASCGVSPFNQLESTPEVSTEIPPTLTLFPTATRMRTPTQVIPTETPTNTPEPSPTSTPEPTATPEGHIAHEVTGYAPGSIIVHPDFDYNNLIATNPKRETQEAVIQFYLDMIQASPANEGKLEAAGISSVADLEARRWELPQNILWPESSGYFDNGYVGERTYDKPVRLDKIEFVPIYDEIATRETLNEILDGVRGVMLYFDSYGRHQYGVVPVDMGDHFTLRLVVYLDYSQYSPELTVPQLWAVQTENPDRIKFQLNRTLYLFGLVLRTVGKGTEDQFSTNQYGTGKTVGILDELYGGITSDMVFPLIDYSENIPICLSKL